MKQFKLKAMVSAASALAMVAWSAQAQETVPNKKDEAETTAPVDTTKDAAVSADSQPAKEGQGAESDKIEEIVVLGQRASVQSAQEIKRKAEQVVDSIVAEDIGKLPDRSISEALTRVPGITVTRYNDMKDPEHFAGEGSGVAVRGLSQVRAELNGRDIFSAAGGRSLSFDDVPAELMAGVDVFKSPTPDMIEGGLGGTVNLRTRMPFDQRGSLLSATVRGNYGDLIKEVNGEYSALASDQWQTDFGRFGALVDISSSDLSSRADNIYTRAYFTRTDLEPGQTVYVPHGADWRRNDFERQRNGQYLALQWAPNDSVETFITAFRSEHDSRWDEAAFFTGGGGLSSFTASKGADDWVYDSHGRLLSGTLSTVNEDGMAGNGYPFGTSTRYSANDSVTTDYSTGIKWHPTDRLTVSADLQYIKAKSKGEDYTIGLEVYPDSITVKGLDGAPSIAIDPAFMTDYRNYSYGQMMAILSNNEAESKAGRIDLKYDLEDSLVTSVQAGARFSNKSSDNRGGSTWSARYQAWQVGNSWQPFKTTGDIPKISDPSNLVLFSYGDFQRGNISVPEAAYLINPALLKDFRGLTDSIVAATADTGACCAPDWNALDFNNPDNINTQDEKTGAGYLRFNFDFDSLGAPVDGNVGVRYVRTSNTAHGQLQYPTYEDEDGNQPYYKPDAPLDAKNDYDYVLPSLNLRLHATDNLLFRAAASKAIWRPDFSQLKALMSINYNRDDDIFELNSDGNPYLTPMKANQYDLSAEWYFDKRGGMAHATLFRKDVSDFFRTITTNVTIDGFDTVAERTGNVGTAKIQGVEVGFSKFFDFLPAPFDGFGVQANYTYIDSSTKVPSDVGAEPVNTDGSTYGTMPFEGLSKHSYNLIGMYEKYGFYSRLAWNWRSEYLVAVGANGWNGTDNGINWKLPVYNTNYGQLDASAGYNISERFSINFDVSNLLKADTEGVIDQGVMGKLHAYTYSQDVRYAASVRFTY